MSTINLHFQSFGQGPKIILLHGLFGSWENLGSIARSLASDYQVYCLDLRNHGRSPHTDVMNYDLMSEDVYRFMQLHGIDKAHLLGHSMGGKTAMQLALNHPEVVDKLLVADIAPYNTHRTMRQLLRACSLWTWHHWLHEQMQKNSWPTMSTSCRCGSFF